MSDELKLISPGEVRVRIAPSPTGAFHIGTARSALFNYLFAKKTQGTFVLRIENTDTERSKPEWEKNIIEGLNWLGLDFQEGPGVGGNFGPYRQSERKEIYQKYIEKLLKEKKIYYCFCSLEELEAHKNYLIAIGQPVRYSEKCVNLSEKEIAENLKQRKPCILRFKTPLKKIIFKDLLRGEIEQDSENFGDMVVARGLNTPLYNLALVIDDFEMKITHVIRGEDHISNTPKQILFAEALGIESPKYVHVPIILGQDRTKLSKRHGAKSIMEYKKDGYLAPALLNFLAFLGWSPKTNKEIFSLPTLIQEFSLKGMQKSSAVFNLQKLDWMNGFYIRQQSKEKITELCFPYLIETDLIETHFKTEQYPPACGAGIITQKFRAKETKEDFSFEHLASIVGLYHERLKKLSEISELVDFFFKKKLIYSKELLSWKGAGEKEIKQTLERLKKTLDKIKEENWERKNLEQILLQLAGEIGEGDRGKLLWPLRVALSGKKASAGPFEIAEILGKEKTLKRIEEAKKILSVD
jgi:glutamyl-tRNA synthetase